MRFTKCRNDLAALFDNFVVILLPSRRDSFEHGFESGLTVSVLWWEIGSSNKWLQVRRQPDTHRPAARSEEHTSELQSQSNLVCRLLLEKKQHTHEHAYPLTPLL